MERHGRRDRASGEHQSRVRDSGDHPSNSRHHKSHQPSNETSRRHKKVPRPELHRDGAHAKLPKETPAGPLNGDDDYVRRWLANTDGHTNQDLDASRKREITSRYEQEERTHTTHVKPKYRLEPQGAEEALPPIRKRKHASSSDSSILAVPIRPKSQQLDREETSVRNSREKTKDSPRKKQRIESSGSSSSDPFSESPAKETFEKRARHKTREDKYEPKIGDKNTKKDGTKRRSRGKKEKKSDRRKVAKKSGEELMQNFSSKSIGQERLTVRPPQGLGLFNNGRASSPARRRGLSDLAFSEMNFLQHSNRHPQAEQKPQASSKSREKEKRKASRAQEEITEFFRPGRKPLEETHFNKDQRRISDKSTEKRSVYVKQVERENRDPSHDDIRSLDPRERPYVGMRNPDLSSERLSTYRSDSPAILDPRKHYESASKASEKGTTYVSWSETQLSPSTSSRRPTFIDRRHVSPTPESVRRSIENTGIFRDTGIERKSTMARRNDRPSSRLDETKASYASDSARYSQVRASTSPRRPSPEVSHLHWSRPRFQDERPMSASSRGQRRSPSAERQSLPRRPRATKTSQNSLQETSNVRRRTVIEQFVPERGWVEAPTPLNKCASRTSDLPRESKSTPIDRQELAKAARIKRPSTTLPVSRIHTEGEEQKFNDHAGQGLVDIVQPREEQRDDSLSVEKSALPEEKEPTSDNTLGMNNGQHIVQDNNSRLPNVDNGQELASDPGYELHEFGERRDGLRLRPSPSVNDPQNTNSVQDGGSSTYLGLPLRGSWDRDQQYQPPVVSSRLPYFLHQMHQEAPGHYNTVPEHLEVAQYELYDIPEEEEIGQMQEEYNGYAYNEAHVSHDPIDSHDFQDLHDASIEDVDLDNVDQIGIEYHPELSVYEEPELSHYPDGGGQGEMMYENTVVEDEFIDQGLEMSFQTEGQEDYHFYDSGQYDHMEGLWRAQRPY